MSNCVRLHMAQIPTYSMIGSVAKNMALHSIVFAQMSPYGILTDLERPLYSKAYSIRMITVRSQQDKPMFDVVIVFCSANSFFHRRLACMMVGDGEALGTTY